MKPYYQDDYCTIYHGDCREILPSLPKVDLVLTDPPYGIGASRNDFIGIKPRKHACSVPKDYGHSEWDNAPVEKSLLQSIISHGSKAIVFGGNFYELPASRCWLVWDKDNGNVSFADCELAWTNLEMAVRKFRFKWQGMLQENMASKEVRVHPTQKPVPLMTWCINFAPDAQTILDPFMGSGTTLRAAKDLRRKCIGIEIEEKYCEIAVQRLRQEVLAL